jgi:superfamily II DNA helicase RecQ
MLSKALECLTYHGQLSSDTKADVLTQWSLGKQDVVATTSAFGAGVHHPAIRIIIHVRAPDSVINYA